MMVYHWMVYHIGKVLYKYWEGIVIKVSGGGLQNSTVIFYLYRPPKPGNDILKEVIVLEFSKKLLFILKEVTVLECIERQNANIILASDTNINLLKMHENIMYCDFFDVLMAHNLCPHITFPTRFSNKNGTLIDNIFCKLLPCTQEHCSGILIKKLSDHLPCFMLINSQTRKRPPPKYMTIKQLTQHALLNIQIDLVEKNIYDKLDKSLMADVNQNYNIMHQEIYDTIEKHTLKKTVKLNKHKHKISKWISHGIIKSIKYRDKLYKTLKMTHESPNYTILKVKIINQIINTGVFPNKLKIAKITPISKKDDRTLFTNYRPISLLPIFSKVIEKVICIQINDFFVENKLFFNHQYGFRSGHSTELAALELTDRIITALDNHNTPLNIFLNLSKAFDTLDHTILSDKRLYY